MGRLIKISMIQVCIWFPVLILVIAGCGSARQTGLPGNHGDHSEILIYGGEPVDASEWRGVVAITRRSGDGSDFIECSGTLFHPQYVLTAGHCLDDAGLLANDPNALAKMGVYFGSGNEGGKVSGVVPIKSVKVHQALRLHPGGYADIAVIELAESVNTLPTVQLVASVDGHQTYVTTDIDAKLIGYGRREDGGRGQKFMADVKVRDIMAWESKAGAEGKDACEGDSGGPAFVKYARGEGWRQVGIVSRTWTFGCGQGGYLTNIAPHACWITSVTGVKFPGTSVQCQPAKTYTPRELSRINFKRLCIGKGANKFQSETVQRLKHHYKESDCSALEQILTSDTLKLDNLLLRDLSPLAPFTQVQYLSLSGNLVTDAAVLLRFKALKRLSIDGNNLAAPVAALKPLKDAGTVIKGIYSQIDRYGNTPFSELCPKTDLSDELKKTIKAVFAKTLADDCKTANSRLLSLKSLKLEDRGLTELSPLSALPLLESLDLSGNPISDISMLATLENLKSLNLQNTQVTDLLPLQELVDQGLDIKL